MPQRKSRKRGLSGVSKVSGYTYTRIFQGLRDQIESLQQHAHAARQHIEASKRREMVLLDLTLHQEQIIALYNQHLLTTTCQEQQHQPLQQTPRASGEQQAQAAGCDCISSRGAAAVQPHLSCSQQQHSQQPCQFKPQGLHVQLPHQVPQPQVQQQQQQQQQQLTQSPDYSTPSIEHENRQQHQEAKQLQVLGPPGPAAASQMQQAAWEDKQQDQQLQDTAGYVGSLLKAAAEDPAWQRRVMTMTAADWSKFFTESFYKLLLLLELADRGDEVPCELMLQHMSMEVQTPLGGGSAGANQAGGTGVEAAAKNAAIDATDSNCGHATRHMQQLDRLVDEWVMLSMLALILNPLPLYMATTINHATQSASSTPKGHFDRVVRRLCLTKQQVHHFAAVLEEIARLDYAVMAEGGQLARNAACPSTVVLAAEAERSAADSATTSLPPQFVDAPREQENDDKTTDGGKVAVDPEGGKRADAEGLAPPSAESLLQRNVGRLPLNALLIMMFNCNTLTRLQLAQCIVTSYPYLPMTGPIAASAAALWHQYVEQQQQQHQDKDGLQTAGPPALRDDEADELCCQAKDVLRGALYEQQLQVLRQRRALLDKQLQQWWQELRGLELDD